MNRRNFLKNASLVAAAGALPLSSLLRAGDKKLNILVLGGTGFLGPHTVNAALAQGHNVTLFNRGKTNPELFKHLETVKGDRNTDAIKKLAGRKFDAVIDTSAYYPRSVDMAMDVMKDNIGQYLIVSTISVYANWAQVGMDESGEVGKLDDPTTEEVTGETYGPLKALCEQAAEKHMPGRVTVIRPGLIVGPRDKTDRFTYWPMRVHKGGEVLAPGDGSDHIQYIDVRDLGEWMIYCLENSVLGTYNAQTNGNDITIKQLLDTCVETINPSAKLVWVPTDFLQKHEVAPWQEMPVWIPPESDYAGAGSMSSEKAYQNGLKERPMKAVVKDCFDWFTSLPEERQQTLRAGISAEKEAGVLAAWKASQAG
ncbi:NAD-dependent epimerase/dehydratase family protein [Porticoccus sp. W117]|uniref:NAD-dependent epimerase/dehydratase family protein n=1 Tax=Porticoccus sp. W117 TaxID=3054777 RepID=UPI00259A7910|nr:NAD-dependent epimerase/dehydratase family protein [Porticoccus sp. W117]MDM3871425.1 NAD-dependent epimerase/dehydratase family protein [Porticoccus sp. W117]